MRHLREEPLDPAEVLATIRDERHGGSCLFSGSTRADEAAGKALVALDYQADVPLAEKELARVIAEAEARFGVAGTAVHRLGRVPVGELSVIVAASGPHRDEAFAACRYLIDEIKARAPIWKREIGSDGDGRWLDGRVQDAIVGETGSNRWDREGERRDE